MTELEYIEYVEDLEHIFICSPWGNDQEQDILLSMIKNIGIKPRRMPRNMDNFESAMWSSKRFWHDDTREMTEEQWNNIKEAVSLFVKNYKG